MQYVIDYLFQVFPPIFGELPPPPLELFDLDEAFSSERAQLAQLANRCLAPAHMAQSARATQAELDFLVRESARALGVDGSAQGAHAEGAKFVLNMIAKTVARFKMMGSKD